ncbi:hypothetical protein GCM10027614_59150 [Micromonospora vulcania]
MTREPPISTVTPPSRLYRAPEHRMAAGVAAGIADHLGISVLRVRVAFMVLLGLSGLGLLLYAAFWAVVPLRPGDSAMPPRRDVAQLLPFVGIGLGVLLIQVMVFDSVGAAGTAGWLVAIIAVGAGVIWHQSAPSGGDGGATRRCRGSARSSRRVTGGPSCSGSSVAGCWSRSASSVSRRSTRRRRTSTR